MKLTKKTHSIPMLSTHKFKKAQDIANYFKKTYPDEKELLVDRKHDGLACAITQHNGTPIKVLTRNNGIEGIDILPALQARREANLLGVDALTFQKEHQRAELVIMSDIPNYRQVVAGMARTPPKEGDSYMQVLPHCQPRFRVSVDDVPALDRALRMCSVPAFDKEGYRYPTDGAIVFIDRDEVPPTKLPYPKKYKTMVAYKPKDDTYITTILAIDKTIGAKTKKISNIATIEPIEVRDGCLVKRIMLYTDNFVCEHRLEVGSRIQVKKAGGVLMTFDKKLS